MCVLYPSTGQSKQTICIALQNTQPSIYPSSKEHIHNASNAILTQCLKSYTVHRSSRSCTSNKDIAIHPIMPAPVGRFKKGRPSYHSFLLEIYHTPHQKPRDSEKVVCIEEKRNEGVALKASSPLRSCC